MITVLRLGHRISRDKRITTHVALVARALSANKILIDTKDKKIEENIKNTINRFGNGFIIETGINPKKIINSFKGTIIHLTMYGDELNKTVDKIKTNKDLLIIVGAEKVPAWIYEKADYNISVGNQPHSEVSALAIFLDRITNGNWLNTKFNGKLQIIPCNSGKKVISKENKK